MIFRYLAVLGQSWFLIFVFRYDFAEAAAERIRCLMEGVAALKVPLEVGIGIADSWADAH